MPRFSFKDGGTVVQYNIARILSNYKQNVKIYSSSEEKIPNSIFRNFYNNDFPIDDNCIVLYVNVNIIGIMFFNSSRAIY